MPELLYVSSFNYCKELAKACLGAVEGALTPGGLAGATKLVTANKGGSAAGLSKGVTGIRLAAVVSHSKAGSQVLRCRLEDLPTDGVCRRQWRDTGQHKSVEASRTNHRRCKVAGDAKLMELCDNNFNKLSCSTYPPKH